METEESGKEGGRLAFVSVIIILFFLAGGQLKGSNVAIQMVNLEFTRSGVILVFAWVYLIWLAFRCFQITNEGLSQMVKKEYDNVNAYGWSGDLFKIVKETLKLKDNVIFRGYSKTGSRINFNVLNQGGGNLYLNDASEEAKRNVNVSLMHHQSDRELFTISSSKDEDNSLIKNLDRLTNSQVFDLQKRILKLNCTLDFIWNGRDCGVILFIARDCDNSYRQAVFLVKFIAVYTFANYFIFSLSYDFKANQIAI